MKRILVGMAALSVATGAFAQISEVFDDITTLVPAGWSRQNLSNPVGATEWFQGNPASFPSHQGLPEAYIAANFQNTAGVGDISNWLITPEQTLNNGAVWSFWSRSATATTFPDRLHFKMSTNGASVNVADFTTVLLTINPDLLSPAGSAGAYPDVWTEFSGVISGLGGPTQGRLAFHYDVPDSGPSGFNGDYIGIDTFDYNPVPEPATIAVLALGLGALVARRRKA
ncbi:MAG: PEP-CTERM sorting domain-containing protein [Armatimonadota bacterium]|nr:PEP-CTERM sorting domain-containing protein [Armatimonadota bacterium]